MIQTLLYEIAQGLASNKSPDVQTRSEWTGDVLRNKYSATLFLNVLVELLILALAEVPHRS